MVQKYTVRTVIDIKFPYFPGWMELNLHNVSDTISHKRSEHCALENSISALSVAHFVHTVERTADPSERLPILPVLQGHTKNSPLPPSLQGPCVVLATFEHYKLFYLLFL